MYVYAVAYLCEFLEMSNFPELPADQKCTKWYFCLQSSHGVFFSPLLPSSSSFFFFSFFILI